VCARLAIHPDFNMRGNALLGLGHLARLHRMLDRHIVQPLIEQAFRDDNDYVRGHAREAAEDVTQFLGWTTESKTL